ncbi:LOW QUALITY PROTEIN: insulin-like peptide receptor [Tetranychus urticae]|uniref:LOW QUALITY PROTEIN: insulin-like peptide receptor n=1 Tax=Tetranychus urticae TaxID=32264 RepID=UPI000D646166|nr:LOW QUALITY PROTEIN: insulin-like peptide receptor [Tetranychus urticae]
METKHCNNQTQQHHHHCHWYLVYHLIFFWLIISQASGAIKEKTCGSLDIRDVSELKQLENCTVIEGSLQISTIYNGTSRHFENISFPLLTEVTDYVLIFRVSGIITLAKLFPNLTVIRGQHLFHNFALIIYDVTDLQEIGLSNLTTIVKGAVRIEKNRHLCFAETVNWDLIAKSGKGSNHVKDNKPFNECPKCYKNGAIPACPILKSGAKETHHGLCWNSENCQRICSNECESQNLTCNINNPKECCDPSCIGGCTGKTNKDCLICKNFVKYEGHEKICVKRCGPNQYEFLSRRCVSFQDCIALSASDDKDKKKTYKIFESRNNTLQKCLAECPPGYQQSPEDEHKCDRCQGSCKITCKGNSTITNVAAAQNFRGCTVIDGYLDISVQGGVNIITELEESLQQVRTITGYLKIARSYPLITLNFFKDLETIEGNILDRTNYSLVVIDNPNLQELFPLNDNGTSKVYIMHGKIFFHINPKLCTTKIKQIHRKIAIEDDKDISPYSNGDKTACELIKLNLTIASSGPTYAYLQWPNFLKNLTDARSLLGYLVYYREAPGNTTVSVYGGRDACYSNGWNSLEVEADEDRQRDTTVEYLLTKLEPFTRYATYVKTYTIRTPSAEGRAGESSIVYFQTKPTTPSEPRDLGATVSSSSEIIVHWSPPKEPNGIVTHYMITVTKILPLSEAYSDRDFCSEPLNYETPIIPEERINVSRWLQDAEKEMKDDESEATKNNTDCCPCQRSLVEYEDQVKNTVDFEDYLINNAYKKYNLTHETMSKPEKRKKRSPKIDPTTADNNITGPSTTLKPQVDVPEIRNYIATSLSLLIQNLTHYTDYKIAVSACHTQNTPSNKEPEYKLCGEARYISQRTLAKANADEIDPQSLTVEVSNANNSRVAFIKWDEPSFPNGEILSYHLEYKPNEASMSDSVTRCITRKEYQESKGIIRIGNLISGKSYVLRVRAMTRAGRGNFTRYYEFEVPSDTYFFIFLVLGLVLFMLFTAIISVGIFIRRKISGQPGRMIFASINPEYITHQPDEWEVCREDISLLGDLGQGSFGMVHLGEMKSKDPDEPSLKVAVKTVTDPALTKAFLNEAQVMKTFDCQHVVKLLGVVSTSQPPWVIMELMPNGDLRNYLLKQRPDNEDGLPTNPPSLTEIWRMSVEIADGMAYLGSRKFVHRDLAARNIMVAHDLTVKIGDFGMTRDIYETDYYRKDGQGLLPIRWMSPESIRDGIFNYTSDVWSYGIVLYEMATLGAQPYQGLGNMEVIKFITEGGTIEKPKGCPDKLFELMSACWMRNPKQRPTFFEIIDNLLPLFDSEKFMKVSFYAKAKAKTKLKSRIRQEITCTTPLKSSTACKYNEDDELECSEHEIEIEETDNGEEVKFFPTNIDTLNSGIVVLEESGVDDSESTTTTTTTPKPIVINQADKNISNGNINDVLKVNKKNIGENGKGGGGGGGIGVGGGVGVVVRVSGDNEVTLSPDHDKDRKLNQTSNGGLVNGPLSHYNTTIC